MRVEKQGGGSSFIVLAHQLSASNTISLLMKAVIDQTKKASIEYNKEHSTKIIIIIK